MVLVLAAVLPVAAAGKKKAVPEPYGLVAGSVFRDSGYALPYAEITLVPNPPPNTSPVKVKKMQAVSDARGEFVFRVPPATMTYLVKVVAKGFHSEEKAVTIQGEERVDVTFMLHEESK